MANTTTQIAEALQAHNIDLMRLEASMRKKVVALFNRLGPALVAKVIAKAPHDAASVAVRNRWLNLLVTAAGTTIDKAYQQIEAFSSSELERLAGLEAAEATAAINGVLNVNLAGKTLSAQKLTAIAGNTLIRGAPSSEWWGKQVKELRDAFRFQMRLGVLNNETIPQLVQRVRGTKANGFSDGIMKTATHKAEALVRSSVMAVANEARLELYRKNEDIIKGMQWLSTLDASTTDICKALDGQAWYLDGRAMPGTQLKYRGPPPAHWNCRSTMVPVLRSWSDLAKDPSTRKKLAAAEGRLPPGFRASMDGRVSEKLNYEEWLKTKDEAFQLDVLGPTKLKLWKKGKLPFTELVSQNHNPLTVAQIEARVSGK